NPHRARLPHRTLCRRRGLESLAARRRETAPAAVPVLARSSRAPARRGRVPRGLTRAAPACLLADPTQLNPTAPGHSAAGSRDRMAPRPASIALLALCMSASLSHGANAGARTLAIPRLGSAAAATGGPPGVVVTPFVQRDPHDGVPCSRGTMARVYYDDDELHVEFACDD